MNKIKAKEEGRKGIYIPEKQSLIEYIKGLNLEQIHNFIPSGMMMLGTDHSVESVMSDIENGDRLAIFTDGSANMGHSLAIIKNEKLECYDIGKISIDNIDLTH
jgi:hypothetical protein